MRKDIWITILITVLCIASIAGCWFLLQSMGQDPWTILKPRPIGPVLPPIRIPKI